MGNYKNGIETKKALYHSAKKLFYLKGYRNTTIKDIIIDANSKLGLFTYYYDSKESVALSIFREFNQQILLILKEPLKEYYDSDDYLLVDMIEYRSYFKCIRLNESIIRFYIELTQLENFINITKDIQRYYKIRILEKTPEDIINPLMHDKHYFEAINSLFSGMEVQYTRDLLSGNLDLEYDDAIDLFLTQYYGYLTKNHATILNMIQVSRKIADNLEFNLNNYFDFTIKI